MDAGMESQQVWFKTRTPASIEEWRWMAKNVWATDYDFSKPLEMKKKRKRRLKCSALQASFYKNQLQRGDTEGRCESRPKKKKKQIAGKRSKMPSKPTM